MNKLIAGSRESQLAVIQTKQVMDAIRTAEPNLRLELLTMKTTGDRILDRTLDKIGGKGLFVKELESALLEHRADFTVHSCKDLPMEVDPRIPLVAFSRREDPRDTLVLPLGATKLDPSKPIGCASARRRLQLQKLFPEMQIAPIRGNVQTRLGKLDGGEYAALVLAAAGLKRLGLEERMSRIFSTQEILPAAGQGILVVQARAGEDNSYLRLIHDDAGTDCALAERAFVRGLDGGCSAPMAAFAVIEGENIRIQGMDVSQSGELIFGAITGQRNQAEALGLALAYQLRGDIGCAEK